MTTRQKQAWALYAAGASLIVLSLYIEVGLAAALAFAGLSTVMASLFRATP